MTTNSYKNPLKDDIKELEEDTLNKSMDNDIWIQEIKDEKNKNTKTSIA